MRNTEEGINVLSLFDGMSCGQIALEKAGIKVKNYYASEIEKDAITVTMNNYPNTKQLGDIRNININDLPKIDLVIGGSPCQGFSMLGKQLNFDDPKSKLYFEYVGIVCKLFECNPTLLFLLENVKMKKEFEKIISHQMGVQPIEINASLVSAQNRRRLYWTNIKGVTQPSGPDILLKDILQSNVDEKYFISGKRLENWNRNSEVRLKKGFCYLNPVKAGCLTARMYANWYGNHVTENGRIRQLTPIECERCQCLQDGYTSSVSDASAYKMLGNGWNVQVIKHIFSFL